MKRSRFFLASAFALACASLSAQSDPLFRRAPGEGSTPGSQRWIAHFAQRPFDLERLRAENWGPKRPHVVDEIVRDLEARMRRHQAAFVARVEDLGGKVLHQYWLVNACAFELPAARVAAIRAFPNVAYLQPDVAYPPMIKRATSEAQHQGDRLHTQGARGAGATIAILDGGHDSSMGSSGRPHITYSSGGSTSTSRLIFNKKMGAMDPNAVDGHGTGTSSCAAGWTWRTANGDTGFAYQSRIAGYAIADFSNGNSYTSTMARAWQDVVANRARYNIVAGNLSYGGSNSFLAVEQKAIDNCANVGDILCCTAAGNGGSDISGSQANLNGLAVGATGFDYKLASFSARGQMGGTARPRVFPDMTANGVGIRMARDDNESADYVASGTSFASPMVAGMVAQIRAKVPSLKADQAKAVFLASSWPNPGAATGVGTSNGAIPGVGTGWLWGRVTYNTAVGGAAYSGRATITGSTRIWRRSVTVKKDWTHGFAISYFRKDVNKGDFTDLNMELWDGNRLVAAARNGWSSKEFLRYKATADQTLEWRVYLWRFHGGETSQDFAWACTAPTAECVPEITQQPSARSLCLGYLASNTTVMSVTARNATGYQWRRNGASISGQTSSNLTLSTSNVTSAVAGAYDCVVTGHCGTVISRRVNLTVTPTCRELRRGASASGPNFGSVVANVGDIDNDGYPDLGIGHPEATYGSANAGWVQVLSGRTHGQITFWRDGVNGAMQQGYAMAGADVNADGYSDVFSGAPGWSSNRGKVVWYSRREGRLRDVALGSSAGQRMGSALALGHLDEDAQSDLVVAGRDTIYAFSSRSWGSSAWPQLWKVTPLPGVDVAVLVRVGDVDFDGYDDFAVGMPSYGSNRGAVQMRSGRDGRMLWQQFGSASGALYGKAIARAGDVTKDGVADLHIGEPGYAGDYGRLRSVHGDSGSSFVTLNGAKGAMLGRALAYVGDYDKDGEPDFAVGQVGRVEIRRGRSYGVLWSRTGGSRFGEALAGLDSNMDSKPDVAVGEPGVAVWLRDAAAKASPPKWELYGATCKGSAQRAPRLRGGLEHARVGGSYDIVQYGLPANSAVALGLAVGKRNIPLDAIGMNGCSIWIESALLQVARPTGSGEASVRWSIPNEAKFAGVKIHWQSIVLDSAANSFGVTTSPGLEMTIGAR